MDDSFGSGRYVSPLRIDRLTKRYRGATRFAVNNLSLNVTRGEVIALCGANGAGKSTLLSMLTGLLQPTSGGMCLYVFFLFLFFKKKSIQ